jgi:uncharacterized membrane protein
LGGRIPLPEKIPDETMYSSFFEQEVPLDLTLVVVWLVVSIAAIYLPILTDTPLRIVLTLPVILFIPGYCLIAALFPKEGDVDLLERILLSIGLSLAVVPLVGLGLNFTPWGIRLEPLVISLTLFTWVMIVAAHYRRAILPYEERFKMPFSAISGNILKEFFPPQGSRVSRLLSFLLTLVAIIAIITTAYVIAFPKDGERFSEFYILGEKQRSADYPEKIIAGHSYPIYIGIGNHEHRNVTYTIETWTLRTEFDTVTNTTSILSMDSLDRQSLVLSHNETMTIPYTFFVNKTGENRVEFLLFKENVPNSDVTGSDRINASYRDLHLWVTVQEGH